MFPLITYYSKSILGSCFPVSQELLSYKEQKGPRPAQIRSGRAQASGTWNGVGPHGTWSCEEPRRQLILIYDLSLFLCGLSSVPLSLHFFFPTYLASLWLLSSPVILVQDTQVRVCWSRGQRGHKRESCQFDLLWSPNWPLFLSPYRPRGRQSLPRDFMSLSSCFY